MKALNFILIYLVCCCYSEEIYNKTNSKTKSDSLQRWRRAKIQSNIGQDEMHQGIPNAIATKTLKKVPYKLEPKTNVGVNSKPNSLPPHTKLRPNNRQLKPRAGSIVQPTGINNKDYRHLTLKPKVVLHIDKANADNKISTSPINNHSANNKSEIITKFTNTHNETETITKPINNSKVDILVSKKEYEVKHIASIEIKHNVTTEKPLHKNLIKTHDDPMADIKETNHKDNEKVLCNEVNKMPDIVKKIINDGKKLVDTVNKNVSDIAVPAIVLLKENNDKTYESGKEMGKLALQKRIHVVTDEPNNTALNEQLGSIKIIHRNYTEVTEKTLPKKKSSNYHFGNCDDNINVNIEENSSPIQNKDLSPETSKDLSETNPNLHHKKHDPIFTFFKYPLFNKNVAQNCSDLENHYKPNENEYYKSNSVEDNGKNITWKMWTNTEVLINAAKNEDGKTEATLVPVPQKAVLAKDSTRINQNQKPFPHLYSHYYQPYNYYQNHLKPQYEVRPSFLTYYNYQNWPFNC